MNSIPSSPNDPVNTDILMVAEDRVKGFRRLPFHAISEQCGHPVPVVIERLKAMMEAGVVRRVRQTLLATKLAQGALVAWSLPEENLDAAFDWMKEQDPFTGHVVLRNTDASNPGSRYRLWTTVKVPVGCGTLEEHCDILKHHIGAEGPGVFHHFFRPELFLDGKEHLPFLIGEGNGFRFLHGSRLRRLVPGLEAPAAHVTYP